MQQSHDRAVGSVRTWEIVVAVAFFVLHRTRTGRTVYAIGG